MGDGRRRNVKQKQQPFSLYLLLCLSSASLDLKTESFLLPPLNSISKRIGSLVSNLILTLPLRVPLPNPAPLYVCAIAA